MKKVLGKRFPGSARQGTPAELRAFGIGPPFSLRKAQCLREMVWFCEKRQVDVIVVIGAGSNRQAIARRVSAGKHVLRSDIRKKSADAAAKVLSEARFEVGTAIVDVSSRESVHALVETAAAFGSTTGVIHAAGVSPSQASPATTLKVDRFGIALVLREIIQS